MFQYLLRRYQPQWNNACCLFWVQGAAVSSVKQHCGNTVAEQSLGNAAQDIAAMTAHPQRCHIVTKANKPVKQNTLTHIKGPDVAHYNNASIKCCLKASISPWIVLSFNHPATSYNPFKDGNVKSLYVWPVRIFTPKLIFFSVAPGKYKSKGHLAWCFCSDHLLIET